MLVTPETLESSVRSILSVSSANISVDTETTGLRECDRPFSVAVATATEEHYFDNRILDDSKISLAMQDLFGSGKNIIMQNAKFDLRMMAAQWGTTLPKARVFDTEVLGRLVRNDHMSYRLADQVKREGLPLKDDAVMAYIKSHKLETKVTSEFGTTTKLLHYDRVPMEIIAPYAEHDARITFDLHQSLISKLEDRSIGVWDTETKVTRVGFGMERRGICINEGYTRMALAYEEGLIREAKSQFLLATGHLYDNKKTTLVEVFRKAGETIPKTEKGNDQLTDEVLESFSSPAAKIVQKIRFHEKRISTYYTSFLELKDSNNVIHADIRQAGTTTGRFSYRDPNLQNIPKEEKSLDPYVVRGCFAPRPGNIFLSLDYKQQEYRLMLAYAKHRRLISEVMCGADVHQATADLVGISRSHAKTLNFAILYGAGPPKIAGMLGISVLEARALRNKYFDKLLEVEHLIHQVTSTGSARGFIYNWAGRKLFANKGFEYVLPNHLIQSGGADICKAAMAKMLDEPMVLQIHDALVFEVPRNSLDHYAPILSNIMVDAFPEKNGMLMAVDVSWSDKSLAERDMVKWTAPLSLASQH